MLNLNVEVDIDKELTGHVRQAAVQGLRTAAIAIQTEAVKRAPIGPNPRYPSDPQPGTLRRSANNAVNESSLEAEISFDTPYARRQHEETGWNHPRGGQAKYLESALEDMTDEAMQIVSTAIRRAG